MGESAKQQGLFKLRDTYVAYGVRGLIVAKNISIANTLHCITPSLDNA